MKKEEARNLHYVTSNHGRCCFPIGWDAAVLKVVREHKHCCKHGKDKR